MRQQKKANDFKQVFLEQVKQRFKLRSRKQANIPVIIYEVVTVKGQRRVTNTGVKVKPSQWNSKSQCALISPLYSALDNYNNYLTNQALIAKAEAFRCQKEKLCANYVNMLNNFGIFASEINNLILSEMAKTEKKKYQDDNKSISKKTRKDIEKFDVAKVIDEAFHYYYTTVQKVKPSTISARSVDRDAYLKYVGMTKLKGTEAFTQKGVYAYYESLTNGKKLASQTLMNRVGLIVTLINEVITVAPKFIDICGELQRVTNPVRHTKEPKQDKALTSEIIEQLSNCNDYNDREKTALEFFLFQMETGQRIETAVNILLHHKELNILTASNNRRFIVILPKKEERHKVYSYIPLNSKLEGYIDSLTKKIFTEKLLSLNEHNLHSFVSQLNSYYLPVICKKAKINLKITTHWARHTKTTLYARQGYTTDEIDYLTGHQPVKRMTNHYIHLNDQDIVEMLAKAADRVENGNSEIRNFPNEGFACVNLRDERAAAIYLGVDPLLVAQEMDLTVINRLLYNAENEYIKQGLNPQIIKGLWKDETKTLKEKREALLSLVSDFRHPF